MCSLFNRHELALAQINWKLGSYFRNLYTGDKVAVMMLKISALLWVVMLGCAINAVGDEVTRASFTVLDESLAEGWRMVGDQGAHALGLTGDSPVFDGAKAAAVEVKPAIRDINWSLELLPPQSIASQSVTRQGFVGLRFAFHPGDLDLPSIPVFTLYIDALSMDLVRTSHEYQLDFEHRQWQVVEIPFEAFDQINNYGTGLRDQVDFVDSIRIEGNLTGTFYLDDVCLMTASPVLILDESLAEGWRMVGDQGAHALGLTGDSPVFDGAKAAAVEVKPAIRDINWSLELLPPQSIASQSVTRQGFVGLRFAFHPGDLDLPSIPVFTLYIDALGLDLVQTSHEYQLDFEHRQWQVVEIPFEAFDQINYYYGTEPLAQVEAIDSIRIEGNLTGTFYLDDVRLMTGTPPTIESEKTPVETYSWGQLKTRVRR